MSGDAHAELVALRGAREQVVERLSEAFSRDELDLEEFERRLTIAHRTESLAELDALVSDVAGASSSAPRGIAKGSAPAPVVSNALLVPSHAAPEERALAVLGSLVRRGEWRPPRSMHVVSVMGSVELDFREALLPTGVTDVDVFTLMGSVVIFVPPTLAVEMTGGAVLGSFEHASRAPVTPDPERPILRVRGVAVMGSVEIVTRLAGESGFDAFFRRRREKRALREGNKPPLLPSGKR
jgi:hypothetical protein